MATHKKIVAEDAENLAIRSLSYIASDEERLSRFFSVTGLHPGSIREAAASPGFHAAVLDYVASDEPLLIELAKALELPPERIMEAQQRLAPPPFE